MGKEAPEFLKIIILRDLSLKIMEHKNPPEGITEHLSKTRSVNSSPSYS